MFTPTMPPEVVAVIAQNPALQKFYESEYLKAEAAVQDALNEQQRLAQKQAELDELTRKNDMEEQRNADLARLNAKVEQLFALTTGIMDAYIVKHHEPLYSIMQTVLTQLGLILQSQTYVLPELMKRLDDPRLMETARQIIESLRQHAQPPEPGKHVIVYAGDAPTNVNAPGSNINRMDIKGN